jgi:Arc/MetJ family transcription regulator
MTKVRTNIEIEDSYVQTIMRRHGLKTKTEVVDLALRKLAGEPPMTRDEALAMEGSHSIGEVPPDVPPRGAFA